MRSVAIHHVSTVVYAEVGEVSQVAAVLSEEHLLALWQVFVCRTLRSAVERHYHDVGFL